MVAARVPCTTIVSRVHCAACDRKVIERVFDKIELQIGKFLPSTFGGTRSGFSAANETENEKQELGRCGVALRVMSARAGFSCCYSWSDGHAVRSVRGGISVRTRVGIP